MCSLCSHKSSINCKPAANKQVHGQLWSCTERPIWFHKVGLVSHFWKRSLRWNPCSRCLDPLATALVGVDRIEAPVSPSARQSQCPQGCSTSQGSVHPETNSHQRYFEKILAISGGGSLDSAWHSGKSCSSFGWLGLIQTCAILTKFQMRKQCMQNIWQCVKTNSTPVVHIKIAGIYGCSSH